MNAPNLCRGCGQWPQNCTCPVPPAEPDSGVQEQEGQAPFRKVNRVNQPGGLGKPGGELATIHVRQKELLKRSVEITVFRGDEVLAVNSRNFDGFCGVGGKTEPGESFEQAARRELMEETGCEALSVRFIAGHTLDPIKGDDQTHDWYCAGFIVDIGDQEPRPTEEGTTPFWTTKEDMIANSLFPEWYAWWFGLLELLSSPRSKSPATSVPASPDSITTEFDYDGLNKVSKTPPVTQAKQYLQLALQEISRLRSGSKVSVVAEIVSCQHKWRRVRPLEREQCRICKVFKHELAKSTAPSAPSSTEQKGT